MGVFIGFVLNPKTLAPCPVYKKRQRSIEIYTPTGAFEGNGYFESSTEGVYAASAKSGFPRAHTPDGVQTKRMGYGTVLYTGLCLGAHLEDEGRLSMDIPVSGDGISSNSERSASADAWWHNAKEAGLAHEVPVEGGEETEEQEDVEGSIASSSLSSRYSSSSGRRDVGQRIWEGVQDYVTEYDPGDGSSVTSFTIDWQGERTNFVEAQPGIADVYPFEQAERFVPFDTVVDVFGTDGMKGDGHVHAWDMRPAADYITVALDEGNIRPEVFSTMDVSACDRKLVAFLEQVAKNAGLDREWERVRVFAALGIHLAEQSEAYDEHRPFRMNPSTMKQLTRAERVLVQERAELIAHLGLDHFKSLGDIDD